MSAKLLFLLHSRRWQFCSSIHQTIAICSVSGLRKPKKKRCNLTFKPYILCWASCWGENQLFASRLNCFIGETTAVVTPGNSCREQDMMGNGAVVQGSVPCTESLSIFVPVFKCLKNHGNSAKPYRFHTGRKDVTTKA